MRGIGIRRLLASFVLVTLSAVFIFSFQNCGRFDVASDNGSELGGAILQPLTRIAGNDALYYVPGEIPKPQLVVFNRNLQSELDVFHNRDFAFELTACEPSTSTVSSSYFEVKIYDILAKCNGVCPGDIAFNPGRIPLYPVDSILTDAFDRACTAAGGNVYRSRNGDNNRLFHPKNADQLGFVARATYNGSFSYTLDDVDYRYPEKVPAYDPSADVGISTCANTSIGQGNCTIALNHQKCHLSSNQMNETACSEFCLSYGDWSPFERANYNLCWYKDHFIKPQGATAAAQISPECANKSDNTVYWADLGQTISEPVNCKDGGNATKIYKKEFEFRCQGGLPTATAKSRKGPLVSDVGACQVPSASAGNSSNTTTSIAPATNCAAMLTTSTQEKSSQPSQTACWDYCQTKGEWTATERSQYNLCWFQNRFIFAPGGDVASGNNCVACVGANNGACASKPSMPASSKEDCLSQCKSKDANIANYLTKGWSVCWYNGAPAGIDSSSNGSGNNSGGTTNSGNNNNSNSGNNSGTTNNGNNGSGSNNNSNEDGTVKCTACTEPQNGGCGSKPSMAVTSQQQCLNFCKSQDRDMEYYWSQGWQTCWYQGVGAIPKSNNSGSGSGSSSNNSGSGSVNVPGGPATSTSTHQDEQGRTVHTYRNPGGTITVIDDPE